MNCDPFDDPPGYSSSASVSTTIEWIAIDIFGAQRMNPNDFGLSQIFPD